MIIPQLYQIRRASSESIANVRLGILVILILLLQLPDLFLVHVLIIQPSFLSDPHLLSNLEHEL